MVPAGNAAIYPLLWHLPRFTPYFYATVPGTVHTVHRRVHHNMTSSSDVVLGHQRSHLKSLPFQFISSTIRDSNMYV